MRYSKLVILILCPENYGTPGMYATVNGFFIVKTTHTELEIVRIGNCQNLNLSELQIVRIENCHIWKWSESENVIIGAF